ncbi:hypothetical protein AAFF_G00023430 [Aldrovandia affinis]|uniref:Uncharacterized protein n=1 Tax=Aldrovandia affinis TaxID=143900 RepID=A0AAD7T5Q6_9TELE|nr:hypothetical protein AAFF_G00023430 [Aldrovandia affinis]
MGLKASGSWDILKEDGELPFSSSFPSPATLGVNAHANLPEREEKYNRKQALLTSCLPGKKPDQVNRIQFNGHFTSSPRPSHTEDPSFQRDSPLAGETEEVREDGGRAVWAAAWALIFSFLPLSSASVHADGVCR